MSRVKFSVREKTKADEPYILNAWIRSARDYAPYRSVRSEVFFPLQQAIINKILARSNVVIACHQEEPEQIFGFIVYEILHDEYCVIHWINVKQPFRNLGIASVLVPLVVGDLKKVFHTGKTVRGMKLAKAYKAQYAPIFI